MTGLKGRLDYQYHQRNNIIPCPAGYFMHNTLTPLNIQLTCRIPVNSICLRLERETVHILVSQLPRS